MASAMHSWEAGFCVQKAEAGNLLHHVTALSFIKMGLAHNNVFCLALLALSLPHTLTVALEISKDTHERPPLKSIPCHMRNFPK